jgi:hypothetical protein
VLAAELELASLHEHDRRHEARSSPVVSALLRNFVYMIDEARS